MPRNELVAPVHVCPGIRIQVIDIVQPPGIGIPCIDDMELHQSTVPAALATQSTAETQKAGWRACAEIAKERAGLLVRGWKWFARHVEFAMVLSPF